MLFEVDDETRDFVTIYDRDYFSKQRICVTKFNPAQSLGISSNFNNDAYGTVYQLNFSKNPDDYFSLYKKRTGVSVSDLQLPNDWVIPETVHRKFYRYPKTIENSPKMKKPSNNLDPNMEQRRILKVQTGDSEYVGAICSTGDRIVREKILQEMRSFKQSRTIKMDCSTIKRSSY
ncbi:uncharacterized protein LOC107046362 [Diachasma alloeum]|uniref:uncharacterized protein LOC107046362 n=1 Tax=Diachasma alloeum TaxID=454923 RepID=UPI0007383D98|nr:uncharacterized protein LOC107046362 [Diachasma alloeum]